jgi:hypothetical protein
MICKIVKAEKLMCLIFMKSTKRRKKKKLVLHYSINKLILEWTNLINDFLVLKKNLNVIICPH